MSIILVAEAADILCFMEKVKNISLLLKEMLENQGPAYTIQAFESILAQAIKEKNAPLEKSASAVLAALKKKYQKDK